MYTFTTFKNVKKSEQGFRESALREEILHSEFVLCGKHAKEWIEKCKQMLLEIDELKIWKKKGFESIFHYAAYFAGMSRWAVTDALRLMKKIEDKPALKQVAREKGLNAVRPVVTIATQETDGFWAGKVRVMDRESSRVYVREFKKQGLGQSDGLTKSEDLANSEEGSNRLERGAGPTGQSETLTITLDPEVAKQLLKLKGKGNWNSLIKELLEVRKARLEETKPKPVKTESRHIPAPIEHYVVGKTRGQCGYSDCLEPYEILHHTQRWGLEKIHDPDRIVPLCKAHERIVHCGLVEDEDKPANEWKVRREPVWWDYKYSIDQLVMEYRKRT